MCEEDRQQLLLAAGELLPVHLKKEDAMKEKRAANQPTEGKIMGHVTETELAAVIRNFDVVKENIRVYLTNRETIWENHEDCPKKEVEGTDLVAVFRILLYVQGKGQSSILVKERMMARWNIDLESLYETALKNTMEQAPAQIISLDDMIDYGPEKTRQPEEVFYEDEKTYILGNFDTAGGAATVLYPGVLRTIADKISANLFIVPSSTDEVMIIGESGKIDPKSLQFMLMESNRGSISRKKVLSDQVYYYDRAEQKLSAATTPEETHEQLLALDAICQIGYP